MDTLLSWRNAQNARPFGSVRFDLLAPIWIISRWHLVENWRRRISLFFKSNNCQKKKWYDMNAKRAIIGYISFCSFVRSIDLPFKGPSHFRFCSFIRFLLLLLLPGTKCLYWFLFSSRPFRSFTKTNGKTEIIIKLKAPVCLLSLVVLFICSFWMVDLDLVVVARTVLCISEQLINYFGNAFTSTKCNETFVTLRLALSLSVHFLIHLFSFIIRPKSVSLIGKLMV